MPDYDLSSIECYLFDPDANVRRLIRDSLAILKISRVQAFGQVDQFALALKTATPDLVIIDARSAELEELRLVSQLRQGQAGLNPFAGVIVTAFNPTQQLLTRVTNSGADALLAKPMSPKQMLERITALIETARIFVITSDFVGPDRRKSPRESGGQAPFLEVPNTLRLRATGLAPRLNLRELIDEATAQVNYKRLQRLGFQLAFLADFARTGLAASPPERLSVEHLARLPAVVDELLRRHSLSADAPSRAAVADRADVVRDQAFEVQGQLERGEPVAVDALLERCLDVAAELMPGVDRAVLQRDVSDAAANYRSRLEQMAQARARNLQSSQ